MKPSDKNPAIRKFQSDLLGTDIISAITVDVCAGCLGPASEFRDAVSKKEYAISGMCQTCQDEIFGYE